MITKFLCFGYRRNLLHDSAKEEQAQIEAEISEIENRLRFARIIDKSDIDTSVVSAGCFVKVKDLEFGDTIEYQIVGATESDPSKGTISNESPVGRALIGKKKGDVVSVVLSHNNNTTIRYEILSIRV